MYRIKHIFILLVCSIFGSQLADANNGSKNPSSHHQKMYQIYLKYDADRNGILDKAELKKLHSTASSLDTFENKLTNINSQKISKTDQNVLDSVPLDNSDQIISGAPQPESLDLDLFIRRNPLQIPSLTYEPSKIDGALFSYARDFDSKTDVLEAHGLVGVGFKYSPAIAPETNTDTRIDAINFIPYFAFDQILNNGSSKRDVDKLTYGFASEAQIDNLILTTQFIRAAASYTTDSESDLGIKVLEAEWEPLFTDFGIGAYQKLVGTYLMGRFRTIAHFTTLDVDGSGSTSPLKEGENFSRFGPILGATFISPDLFPKFAAGIDYRHLFGLQGRRGETHYLEATLGYALIEPSESDGLTVGIQAKYRRGETPITEKEIDRFTVGLTILQ